MPNIFELIDLSSEMYWIYCIQKVVQLIMKSNATHYHTFIAAVLH